MRLAEHLADNATSDAGSEGSSVSPDQSWLKQGIMSPGESVGAAEHVPGTGRRVSSDQSWLKQGIMSPGESAESSAMDVQRVGPGRELHLAKLLAKERRQELKQDRAGAEKQATVLETVNGTCWRSLQARLQSTDASIVGAQEHHLNGDALQSAKKWARRNGWTFVASPATPTPKAEARGQRCGLQGGTLVAVRSHLGLGVLPAEVPKNADSSEVATLVPGRLVYGFTQCGGKRGIVVYSLYLWPSEGMTARNWEVLCKLGEHMKGHGLATIILGDFQMTWEAGLLMGWA